MNIADNPHLHKTDVSSRFSSHPMANEIKSLSNEQLINRRKYVEIAIDFWTENKEQAPQDRVDYNLNYFKTELNLINKRL
jgi:tRNA U34 5-carboxymethylaminomethyl modifying GTPase MnmE/TrmE